MVDATCPAIRDPRNHYLCRTRDGSTGAADRDRRRSHADRPEIFTAAASDGRHQWTAAAVC
jgi:hypothetical protein